ncbi:MAG: hypothetical protein JXN61_08565 [Sedimentisphaerales bacterium]|nr:hypothetical protein [Sedimentisphaerales bacterium]
MRYYSRNCKKFISASAANIAANNAGNDITYTFNWDNKVRKALWNESPEDSIEVKYDPLGNRVHKKSTAEGSATEHKYIVAPHQVIVPSCVVLGDRKMASLPM